MENNFSLSQEGDKYELWGYSIEDDRSYLWVQISPLNVMGLRQPTIVVDGSFDREHPPVECDYLEREIKEKCEYLGTRESEQLWSVYGEYYQSYLLYRQPRIHFAISVKDSKKYIRATKDSVM